MKKKLVTNECITNELSKLVSAGGFQKIQYLQQLDELYALRTELANIKLERNRTILEAEKSIGRLTNQLKQAELQLQYQNVLAPTSGIVFEPKARVDGVIGGGDTILTIIPQQGLTAKVYVANKDIGFIKKEQKAQVRVDAFPFTQYGELKGKVKQIVLTHCHQTKKRILPIFSKIGYRSTVSLTQGIKIPLEAEWR